MTIVADEVDFTTRPSGPPPAVTTSVRPTTRGRRAVVLGVSLAFVVGVLSGGSGYRAYLPHDAKVRELYSYFVESHRGFWDDSAAAIPVSSEDPMWGSREAPVTIVQFSDHECAQCVALEDAMTRIREAYGPEVVRIVWKNLPFAAHANSRATAEAAEGVFELAGSRAFWRFHDLALESRDDVSTNNYVAWAREAGVKDAYIAKFKKGLAARRWAPKVNADEVLGQRSLVRTTPTLFVNGVMASGAQPFDPLKKIIDGELVKANAKLAAGTKRADLYVQVSLENTKVPHPEVP